MDECKFSSILSRGPWLNSCFPEQIKCFFFFFKTYVSDILKCSAFKLRTWDIPYWLFASFQETLSPTPTQQLMFHSQETLSPTPTQQLMLHSQETLSPTPTQQLMFHSQETLFFFLPAQNSIPIAGNPASSFPTTTPFRIFETLSPPFLSQGTLFYLPPHQLESIFVRPCLHHSTVTPFHLQTT